MQAVIKVHSRINDFSIIRLHTGLQELEEQVQPTVMQTDSGVDGGNYWTVYIVQPNLHLPKLLPSSLTTYTPLLDDCLAFCMKRHVYQSYPYCFFTLIGPATERVSQYQSMSVNIGNIAVVSYVAMESMFCLHKYFSICMIRIR